MPRKRIHIYIFIISLLCLAFISLDTQQIKANENSEGKLVYVIPVKKEVERGLEAFLKRTTKEATEEGANHIIFEIDTPGGRVDAAEDIANILQSLDIPSTSFIINRALSAGSYIALFTDNIYMKPQAKMGASGVINSDGTAAEKKAQSAWIAAMKSAAEYKGRDPLYAMAMADESIEVPELGVKKGEYLTLAPQDAVNVGYAEGVVNNRVELLHEIGLDNATIVETEPTLAEEAARFLTNPIVIPILLSIASLGLIVELYSPGFGVPGSMGIIALILFFYGHIVAGLAGMEAILLLVIGIALIIAELFVSGGILGLIGLGAVIASLFLTGASVTHMAMSILIALIVAIVAAVILFKSIGMERGIFRRIILTDRTTTELGYVSAENRLDLIGLTGKTLTPLRPSGSAEINGERVDVVSVGTFIERNKDIKVIKVEGVRVVVKEL